MDVVPMPSKILRIANPVIGKSSLPNFHTSKLKSKCVRESTLDELDGSLDCQVIRGRQEQVHMLWHHDKSMQPELFLPFVAIEGFQEESDIGVHNEEPSALPGDESYEVRARR